jgi:hypothetical protein
MSVGQTFNKQFEQYSAWRRGIAARLRSLSDWLREQDLLEPAIEERLRQLEDKTRNDKVMVAFVAEFSRGKSELINAIFFANYGRRIMPASAGRTTMCPTELGYEASSPPCLRLLPIETRLESLSLMEWRLVPEKWTRVDLDVTNPDQMAQAFERVAEVKIVPIEQARALGLWHDDQPEDNPPVNASGWVEVPRWRHAQINVEHPLLKQGLVILDTPGLNAIGAEPELTMGLIPQAHAVVFILGADTGVTKSDLAIWKEHLATTEKQGTRLAVLNKIDTLWDPLSTPQQVQAQIQRQCENTAQTLELDVDQVLAVSAHKGLVAKVNNDADLLLQSRLEQLEQTLSSHVMGRREGVLRANVAAGVGELKLECERVLSVRKRALTEQALELKGLRGKSSSVIRHMQARLHAEQEEFRASAVRIHALRAVHMRLMRPLFEVLSAAHLKHELYRLKEALTRPGIKLNVRQTYSDTFQVLREKLQQTEKLSVEINDMLQGTFRQINVEFGFSLVVPVLPDLTTFGEQLSQVERSHLQYLSLGNAMKLAQPDFAERLVRALVTRLRMIFENLQGEVEMWNRSAASHLDAQMRERRKSHERRIDAIARVQDATSSLEDRIQEIDVFNQRATQIQTTLQEMTQHLMERPTQMAKAA